MTTSAKRPHIKDTKAVKDYMTAYQSLFVSGQIGLIDIIKTNAKLAILAKRLTKLQQEYVLEQLDKFE